MQWWSLYLKHSIVSVCLWRLLCILVYFSCTLNVSAYAKLLICCHSCIVAHTLVCKGGVVTHQVTKHQIPIRDDSNPLLFTPISSWCFGSNRIRVQLEFISFFSSSLTELLLWSLWRFCFPLMWFGWEVSCISISCRHVVVAFQGLTAIWQPIQPITYCRSRWADCYRKTFNHRSFNSSHLASARIPFVCSPHIQY